MELFSSIVTDSCCDAVVLPLAKLPLKVIGDLLAYSLTQSVFQMLSRHV